MGASLALDCYYNVIGARRRAETFTVNQRRNITTPHAFSLSFRCHSAHRFSRPSRRQNYKILIGGCCSEGVGSGSFARVGREHGHVRSAPPSIPIRRPTGLRIRANSCPPSGHRNRSKRAIRRHIVLVRRPFAQSSVELSCQKTD
jgi:hypothetical protein